MRLLLESWQLLTKEKKPQIMKCHKNKFERQLKWKYKWALLENTLQIKQ